MFDRHL